MAECKEMCQFPDTKCIKSQLCSSCEKDCGHSSGKHVIFHSNNNCSNILSLTISNRGDCNIWVFKNKDYGNKLADIAPGCTTVFLETNVTELSFLCDFENGKCNNGVCSVCWKGCVCSEVPCICD